MRAAVVTSFGRPPACQDFPEPTPTKSTEFLVDVLAAGLYPRVRAQAEGSHYTSSEELPSSRASTVSGAVPMGPCATSSYPTPRWARWRSGPSSTSGAASYCLRTPTRSGSPLR
jgi:hypothetical protein